MKKLFLASLLIAFGLGSGVALACQYNNTSAESTPVTTAQSGQGTAPHSTPQPANGDGG